MKKHLLYACLVLASLMALPFQSYSQRTIFPACNTPQPLKDLYWLKVMVEDTTAANNRSITIYEARYKNKTIYRVDHILAADAGTFTLYDCLGFVLCQDVITNAGLQSGCTDAVKEVTVGAMLYQRLKQSPTSK